MVIHIPISARNLSAANWPAVQIVVNFGNQTPQQLSVQIYLLELLSTNLQDQPEIVDEICYHLLYQSVLRRKLR